LFLQIWRSLFCSIWSLKTKLLDKTVNSFLLNSKKNKRKKKFQTDRTEQPGPAQPATGAGAAAKDERSAQ
jgi:hypothetical protein